MRNTKVRSAHTTIVQLVLLVVAVSTAGAQGVPAMPPMRWLRHEIAVGSLQGASHGDLPRFRPSLLRLYSDSATVPLWFSHGVLTQQGGLLMTELRGAATRGLRATDYDAESIARGLADVRSSTSATPDTTVLRADAWLTLSALRFVDHAHRGRVDPRALGFALDSQHERHDFAPLVASLSRTSSVQRTIDSIEPPFARFRALKVLLSRYMALAADSTLRDLPGTRATVRPGDAWTGAARLRRLLVALGDLPDAPAAGTPTDTNRFDSVLANGVKRFQRRHGLDADGNLGPATLAQLRVPLARRVTQIELAMERWRWLPDITSPRFVVVNIPAFRLYAFDRTADDQRPVRRMDVIVGSAYRRRHTPVFTGEMRFVVFHPYWDVPPSIARNEEIPRLRRDPAYAERQGFEIVRGGDVGATVYPMTSANLQRVADGTLRLRQRPGPGNALGPVKFVFPNQFNVYLHGTPAQSLFERTRRDFSHGCIRTSDPAGLAEFVLKGQSGWDRARIDRTMLEDSGMLRVTLDRAVPVYILYVTVMTDDAGMPLFYPDLYGHDGALARALRPHVSPASLAR